ncbi:MAG TPA: hypothetical protein VKR61_25665 [Bryobacteraceae bacterium]|nr:hypothetical protein [Bryobacteraceae bacterium]
MRTSRFLFAFGAFAVAGWTQPSAGVSGPVTGFVFDRAAGAVRPMLGIPGAAYLGSGVATGLGAAAVAPDGSTALAVQLAGKLVIYTGLRNASAKASSLTGGIAAADHFAWAADGSAAAVYSSATRQGQVLTGMATSPVAGPPIDLSGLPGQVTALAFDGKRLIAAVSGDSGGIFMVSGSSSAQRIAQTAGPSAVALAGSSLYFADSQSQEIWQVQSYATAPAAALFAKDSSINSPVGLQVSTDGQRILVANAGNRKLAVYDIATRSPVQSIDLAFTPTRLDRFGDESVFLLNTGGQGPVYVVRDGGAGKAAVFFVPAPQNGRPVKAPIHPA